MAEFQVPPNGFVGSQFQTAAVRNTFASLMPRTARTARRKKAKGRKKAARTARAARRVPKVSRSRKTRGAKKLVAGSAAAKAWGRKMKALRKRKRG